MQYHYDSGSDSSNEKHSGKVDLICGVTIVIWHIYSTPCKNYHMADSRFMPSQWEKALFCNKVSHWAGHNPKNSHVLH